MLVRARAIAEPTTAAELRAHYARTRAAFRAPPNAVPDLGIDLKRRPQPAPVIQFPDPLPAPPSAPPPPPPDPLFDDDYVAILTAWHLAPRRMKILGHEACKIVARHFGLRVDHMLGRSNLASLVRARQIAMYICVCGLGFSHPKSGRVVGGRDHTTSLHAFRRIAMLIETDAECARDVAKLMLACGCEP